MTKVTKKVTVKELQSTILALQALSQIQFPLMTAIKIGRLLKSIGEISDPVVMKINEREKQLTKQIKKPNGTKGLDWGGNKEVFAKEVEASLGEEFDFEYEPITLEELSEIKIEPKHMQVIDWLLLDENEKPIKEPEAKPQQLKTD